MREKKKRRKRGITIKIPRSELENGDVVDKIGEQLRRNSKDAYTIMGLMVEVFGIDKERLNGPFSNWPNGAPSLYTRIRLALEKLKKESVINSRKQGKAVFYYWETKE
jgi:hypothetical protein